MMLSEDHCRRILIKALRCGSNQAQHRDRHLQILGNDPEPEEKTHPECVALRF